MSAALEVGAVASASDIEVKRAERFLRSLAAHPFVAFVFDDNGDVHLYTKGINEDDLRTITEALHEVHEEENDSGYQEEG
jgi:hypothetical protein